LNVEDVIRRNILEMMRWRDLSQENAEKMFLYKYVPEFIKYEEKGMN
jgi:hypothetical protein